MIDIEIWKPWNVVLSATSRYFLLTLSRRHIYDMVNLSCPGQCLLFITSTVMIHCFNIDDMLLILHYCVRMAWVANCIGLRAFTAWTKYVCEMWLPPKENYFFFRYSRLDSQILLVLGALVADYPFVMLARFSWLSQKINVKIPNYVTLGFRDM